MTIVECATNLLFHFSPEERSIPDSVTYPGRNAAVLEAMNGALQECFGESSPWVRWEERGAILKSPKEVTIAVTNGSKTATITGWESWMAGCSIVIAGHDLDNQIRNNSASAKLKYPYDGTTGTVSAMVYQDCIALDTDVLAVYGPLRGNRFTIHPRAEGAYSNRNIHDYGVHLDILQVDPVVPRVASAAGQPVTYMVETWSDSDTASPVIRLRLFPANQTVGAIDYRCMLKPPVLSSLSSTNTLPIPFGFVQSIFMPIARKRLMASPFWRDQSGAEEIGRGHQEALDLLKSLTPNKEASITLIPRF